MVIEWLRFWVEEASRERFIQKDDEIWTRALARYPGFLGKDVWISHDSLTDVITVVRWETEEAWFSIPQADLDQVETQFCSAMGAGTYELQETKKYYVRKSTQR